MTEYAYSFVEDNWERKSDRGSTYIKHELTLRTFYNVRGRNHGSGDWGQSVILTSPCHKIGGLNASL